MANLGLVMSHCGLLFTPSTGCRMMGNEYLGHLWLVAPSSQYPTGRISFLMFDHIPEIDAIGKHLQMDIETLEAIEVQLKYAGYIEKEQAIADKLQRLHHVAIPT